MLKIVTVLSDTENNGFLNLLKRSSDRFGLELEVLSINQAFYTSHRIKDILLFDYLEKETNDDDVILFTDAYDAFFVSNENEIMDKYWRFKKKIVFSAEINCWPDESLSIRYPCIESPYKYLCSGGFIGNAKLIQQKIGDKLSTVSIDQFPLSNQIYWTEQFLNDPQNIALDIFCDIFLTLASDLDMISRIDLSPENIIKLYLENKIEWFNENFTINNERICINRFLSSPCHIHANGLSKFLAKEIAKLLNV